MPRVGRAGNSPTTDIGSAPSAGVNRVFDFSSPAGWAFALWIASVVVIAAIYLSL